MLARRSTLLSLQPTLPSGGAMFTMRLGRTPSLPWLPLSTASCRGLRIKPIPLPFGSSLDLSHVPLPAHHSTRAILTATTRYGMRGLFSRPLGCTLHSFGISTGPWPKLLTMQSSSSMTRLSKKLPSATLLSWGPAAQCLLLRLGDPR